METTEIFFFDGEAVRSETVPVQQLPVLSSTRSFWRGNAFSMEDREKMMRQRLATTFLRLGQGLDIPQKSNRTAKQPQQFTEYFPVTRTEGCGQAAFRQLEWKTNTPQKAKGVSATRNAGRK